MSKKVIAFGGQRIFLSDIKNYGTSQKITYYEAVFTEKSWKTGLFGQTEYSYSVNTAVEIDKERYDVCKSGQASYILVDNGYGVQKSYIGARHISPNKAVTCQKSKYLYVTTHNKNYVFWEDCVNFNIYQKCKEIDAAFNMD